MARIKENKHRNTGGVGVGVGLGLEPRSVQHEIQSPITRSTSSSLCTFHLICRGRVMKGAQVLKGQFLCFVTRGHMRLQHIRARSKSSKTFLPYFCKGPMWVTRQRLWPGVKGQEHLWWLSAFCSFSFCSVCFFHHHDNIFVKSHQPLSPPVYGPGGGVLAVAQKQMSCFFQIYQHINVLGLQWITFSFALSLLCSTVNENSRENVL